MSLAYQNPDPLNDETAPEITEHAIVQYFEDEPPLVHHGFASREEAEAWAVEKGLGPGWQYARRCD